jgi:hypothetical protein
MDTSTVTVELDPAFHALAIAAAAAAGQPVNRWIETLIAAASHGDLPFDDCGMPAYIPVQRETAAA